MINFDRWQKKSRSRVSPTLGLISLLWLAMPFASLAQPQTIAGQHLSAGPVVVGNFSSLAQAEALNGAPKSAQPHKSFLSLASTNVANASKPSGTSGSASKPGALTQSPAPSTSFLALLDDQTTIPPDTMGTVGPSHVMTTLNSQVRIHDRSGTTISTISLLGFWGPLGARYTSDPRIQYDPYNNRWLFTTIANYFDTDSMTMIAVSQTSDPTGSWNYYRVLADPTQSTFYLPDYPTLGFNKDWIVINVDMFFFGFFYIGDYMYVLNKTNLYAGAAGTYTTFSDGNSFNLSPAVTFDNTLSTLYLVEDLGMSQAGTSALRLSTITGPVGGEVFTKGTATIPGPSNWQSAPANDQIGQQSGTSAGIELNDGRILNALYRNGKIWAAQNAFLPSTGTASHTAAQWWQIDPAGTVLQFGRIEDTNAVISYGFPSIVVNKNDDALIGYSRFSPTNFASACYSFRSAGDAVNTMQAEYLLKAGEASYFKTFGGSQNRWGDLSASVIDPLNDTDMWTIQEYASLPQSGIDSWGTWWGQVIVASSLPGAVQLTSSSYSVQENTPGFVSITVTNFSGLPGSVEYFTTDGTAVAGTDYLSKSGSLLFAFGESNKSFTIPILDNAVVNPNKTVLLSLTNASGGLVLAGITNATLTIVDDETQPFSSGAGQFQFSSPQYVVTENETTQASQFNNPGLLPTINGRSAKGALITVTRTGGTKGRVLVDYTTLDGSGTAGVDYTKTAGTLVFDDYQMSTNILVPVKSDGFPFGSPFDKTFNIVLSNPRPDPQEDPSLIIPTLGSQSSASVFILHINELGSTYDIERANYRIDEPNDGGSSTITVDVLNPSGEGGSVKIHTWIGLVYNYPLTAGSDYSESQQVQYAQPTFTDGSPPIINPQDYEGDTDGGGGGVTLNYATGQTRKSYKITVLGDGIVEFNEDIYVWLTDPDPNHYIGPNGNALVSILFNDQPAGALDREWNSDNIPGTVPAFNKTPGANGTVYAVAVQPDGASVIGGDFTAVNTITRNRIARMNPDGALDATFNPGVGADSYVASVIVDTAGKILIGGGFSSVNAVLRNSIARLNSDGSLDATFNPGNGANGTVRAMALQADGKILIAGEFTTYNDVARYGIARINSDGSLDTSFDAGSGPDSTVWTVALDAAENILIGGDFFSVNGQPYRRIARLTNTGAVDTTFSPGQGADDAVYALAVQPNDNSIVVGGAFSTMDVYGLSGIARLHPDGSVDTTFTPGSGANDSVYALAIQADGKVLLGGVFTSINSTRRVGFARLNTNGVVDTTFMDTAYNEFAGLVNSYSFEPANFVNAMALQPDGNLMIGGSFHRVGGNPSKDMAVRNHYTKYTRADVRIRYNVARILGGFTPGPGNMEYISTPYRVDENAGDMAVTVRRIDGRLGTIQGQCFTGDKLATAGVDYTAKTTPEIWTEYFYAPPGCPRSVGNVGLNYFKVPILDDLTIEGDETLKLGITNITGTINLGGELIPLGAALGTDNSLLTIVDNDFNYGIINFSATNYVVNENGRTAVITLTRTNGSAGSVTVDYFSRSGPAPSAVSTGGSPDYTDVRGTIRFNAGVTNVTFSVPIINDTTVESDENITLVLTNATGGAKLPGGLPTSTVLSTLTIIDDDYAPGHVSFTFSSYTTNESAGSAVIVVSRTGGSLGAASVNFATSDGTAVNGINYTATNGVLVWSDGDSAPKTFSIPLKVDGLVTGPRTVNLTLSGAANATLGQRPTAVLTIVDGDAYGTYSLSQQIYIVDENGSSPIITVNRTGGTSGTNLVNFATTPGTAVAGQDYLNTNGTLTFNPGESSKSFVIPIINDNVVDGDKTVGIRISLPGNGLLGTPNFAPLTIVDDESENIPAGSLDTALDPNLRADNAIYAVTLQPDGRMLVAGDFTNINNKVQNRVARLSESGGLDTTFDPAAGPNNSVRSMVRQRDGKVLIGGLFTTVNATNRNRVARLNSDGSVDSAFSPGAGADNPVFSLASQGDDKIIVGGAFNQFNGITSAGVVRLNTNGSVDMTFNTGAGANGAVYAVAVQSDGKILVGGAFTAVNGTNRSYLARLNANGSLDTSFSPVFNAAVGCILVQPDGKIVVGGSFATVNGLPRSFLVRLNANGSTDTGFLNGLSGGNNAVYTIAQQVDGKLLVAGAFTRFNDVTRNRLTRLNADGSNDVTINFGTGANDFVATVAIQPDRKIVFGGGFTTYNDQPRKYIARIQGGSLQGSGSLEFSSPSYIVNEDSTNAVISVRRVGGTAGAVSVTYTTGNSTAVAGTDYTAATGSLVFPPGETITNFLVPIINGNVVDGNRTFYVSLSNFGGGAVAGPQPITAVTIIDDESLLSFSNGSFSVNENAPSHAATITVTRSGNTNSAVSANFATVLGGTAIPSSGNTSGRYVITNGTVTFLPGETTKNFNVGIIDDILTQGNQTVNLLLSGGSPQTAVIGLSNAVLTIIDDDFGPGQFVFATNSFSVVESATYGYVTIIRTNGSSGAASVHFATSNGSATAASDYIATNGVVSFADGEDSKNVPIRILNDPSIEPNETILIALSSPTGGATLGGLTNTTLTILDDDLAIIVSSGSALTGESFVPANNVIESNETVTVQFALRNIGTVNTTNLVATLLASNGVTPLTATANYGVVTGNGPSVVRPFQFTASATNGGSITALLRLTDNGLSLGTLAYTFRVGLTTSMATNTNSIVINDSGAASPYPSILNISGAPGSVSKVSVTLTNFTHTYPHDVEVLLVGPSGQSCLLMGRCGNGYPVNNVTLTFDDSATNSVPISAPITTGLYLPTLTSFINFPTNTTPSGPYSTALSTFQGTDPNGVWALYVYDTQAQDAGYIGGWSLSIVSSNTVTSFTDLGVSASASANSVAANTPVTYTISVTNSGPVAAHNVVITNILPDGVTNVGASRALTFNGNVVTCNLGSVTNGAVASFTLTMTPTIVADMNNVFAVGASESDLISANNSAQVNTTVVLPAVTLTSASIVTNGQFQFMFSGSSGTTVIIDASTNLINWIPVYTNVFTNGAIQFTDTNTLATRRFYRARQ